MRDTTIPAMDGVREAARQAREGRGRRSLAAAEVLGDPVHQVAASAEQALSRLAADRRTATCGRPPGFSLRWLAVCWKSAWRAAVVGGLHVRRLLRRCTPAALPCRGAVDGAGARRWRCGAGLGGGRSSIGGHRAATTRGPPPRIPPARSRRQPAARPGDVDLGAVHVDGGNLASIIADAHRYGSRHVMIKSSDGTDMWSQFTPQLVSALHAGGIKVCAWQYVYGNHPVTEAYMGAAAVHDGADCLMIDAETEYEGRYVSAQTYMQRLRTLIGAQLPARAGRLPLRRLPPGVPVLGVPGPGRRAVQRAADVLEATSAPPPTPCSPTPTPTTSSTGARSSRSARSTAARRRTRSCASASSPGRTAPPA